MTNERVMGERGFIRIKETATRIDKEVEITQLTHCEIKKNQKQAH
jgi:hypothetical protein